MDSYLQFFMMPLIGALIGWGTNLFAIKLIFRPHNPVKIPLLGLEFQGLIPKRRLEIAQSIGETLEKEIISPEEIIDQLATDKTKAEILSYIKNTVIFRIGEKLPAFIPSGIKGVITDYLSDIIDRHGNELFDEMKHSLAKKAKAHLNLKGMVEEKINSFDLEQLEDIIIRLSQRELKQIEILGGIIGFFVGLIQAAISYYLL